MTTTVPSLAEQIHFPCIHGTNQPSLLLKGRGQRYRIRFVPYNRIRQITRILIHRAPSTTTADCSWAACACCCPVRLRAAPSACVRILNPRVFSMTDWYIGSAGRCISMTFCRRPSDSKGRWQRGRTVTKLPFQGRFWHRKLSAYRG